MFKEKLTAGSVDSAFATFAVRAQCAIETSIASAAHGVTTAVDV